MKAIPVNSIQCCWTERIAKQWFLITAGNADKCNTMTANWGGIGFMWMKPVVFIVVRPERFTAELLTAHPEFTLSYLPESCRDALNFCGRESGRDYPDKIAAAQLTRWITPSRNVGIAQAELMLECRTLFKQDMTAQSFIDPEILPRWYAAGGMHKLYIAEIMQAYESD